MPEAPLACPATMLRLLWYPHGIKDHEGSMPWVMATSSYDLIDLQGHIGSCIGMACCEGVVNRHGRRAATFRVTVATLYFTSRAPEAVSMRILTAMGWAGS